MMAVNKTKPNGLRISLLISQSVYLYCNVNTKRAFTEFFKVSLIPNLQIINWNPWKENAQFSNREFGGCTLSDQFAITLKPPQQPKNVLKCFN